MRLTRKAIKPTSVAGPLGFAAAILFLSSVAIAQSTPSNPTPSPTPFEPEVISRDDDLERVIRERTSVSDSDDDGSRLDRSSSTSEVRTSLALDSFSEADQKKLVLYLDILTRLEERAESLRARLLDLTEKKNTVNTKLQQVEYNMRPEVISGYTALTGSFRPEDLREQRKSVLEIEKENLEALLGEIDGNITVLQTNLRNADSMAERMRAVFEAVLEKALTLENLE